ncbi:hypothetical protein [Collimonas arenae]|uniref:hypothetical protein n=1 Tax=Collimonas arenae TaxID=279058 RepID=UPI0007781B9B|nr:hypothetical protein [Collimonas arenae]
MNQTIFSLFVSMLVIVTPVAEAHHACLYFSCKDLQECKEAAEWIVEATVVDITHTGGQEECETGPYGPLCGYIENPEILTLANAQVVKGKFDLGPNGEASVSRKDSCFSGALASMNDKPELGTQGERIRLYGDNLNRPPFIHPGYFFVESIGSRRAP